MVPHSRSCLTVNHLYLLYFDSFVAFTTNPAPLTSLHARHTKGPALLTVWSMASPLPNVDQFWIYSGMCVCFNNVALGQVSFCIFYTRIHSHLALSSWELKCWENFLVGKIVSKPFAFKKYLVLISVLLSPLFRFFLCQKTWGVRGDKVLKEGNTKIFKRRGKLASLTGKANEVLERKLTRLLPLLVQEAGREEGSTN